MGGIEVLIVGPPVSATGGISRYISGQLSFLPPGVTGRLFPNGATDGASRPSSVAIRSLRRMVAFLGQSKPDVVHVHTSHGLAFVRSAYFVLVSRYVWHVPVVLHIHGSSFGEFVETDSATRRWLLARVFEAVDRTIVLSEYWATVLSAFVDPEQLLILPNAVDPSTYEPSFDDPSHVVSVSNLIPRKGVSELLTAIQTIAAREGPPFRATIAGRGELASDVREAASTHRLLDYRGHISENEKRRLLSESGIFVLPTQAEGLPISLLEAMAGGNAIVSTRVGGIPDLVGPDGGILVDPGDSDALCAALVELLDDPERVIAMGMENRRRIEATYSWQALSTRLGALYEDLVGERTE